MRSVKREARGISPIIATILLIAVTAVAGGVIATYVVGLYVTGGTSILVGDAGGFVYDWDNTAPVENYKNGLVSIAVEIKSGTMRNIGDPTYGGTAITITNPTTGFTATATFSGTDNWGKEMRTNFNVTIASWPAVSANNWVTVDVKMVPDSRGRLAAGDTITILLQPYGLTDAHDDSVNDNKRVDPLIWDERQTFNVTIAGRDSLSFLGYSGAYLGGTAWSV